MALEAQKDVVVVQHLTIACREVPIWVVRKNRALYKIPILTRPRQAGRSPDSLKLSSSTTELNRAEALLLLLARTVVQQSHHYGGGTNLVTLFVTPAVCIISFMDRIDQFK